MNKVSNDHVQVKILYIIYMTRCKRSSKRQGNIYNSVCACQRIAVLARACILSLFSAGVQGRLLRR